MNIQDKYLKAALFAAYFDVDCFHSWALPDDRTIPVCAATLQHEAIVHEGNYLILTDLLNITDEDAKVCMSVNAIDFNEDLKNYGLNWLLNRDIDYLRSRGYAMEFRGLQVNEQISKGWIKLRQD